MFSKLRIPLSQTGLLLLCAAWLLPGLVGHAPWKGGDGDHFVQLLQLLHGGAVVQAEPPLYYWTAAATAWLTAPILPLHDGARLASGVFIALTLAFAMRSARALYGTEAGWAAVLLLLGCLGLLVRGHELNAYTAQFAGAAVLLYGVVCLPQGTRGGTVFAVGAVLMLMAGGAAEVLLFLLLALCTPLLFDVYRSPAARRGLAIATAAALTFTAAWLAFLSTQGVSLMPILGLDRWFAPGKLQPAYYPVILAWFAWPAWPLAAWAMYRERRQWRTPGIALPVLLLLGLLALYAFVTAPGEVRGLVLLLPIALLGAKGLFTLRRGAANALLWFGAMLFGFIGLVFWVYWGAHDLGAPERLARRLVRLGMAEVGTLRPWALLLGGLVTLAWAVFLVRVKPSPLRPMWVWTVGLTFVWVLLMALFLGPLDRRLSYVSVAQQLVARVPAGACVQTRAVRTTQRGVLAYHSGLDLLPDATDCDWLLVQTRQREAAPQVTDDWVKLWDGARPGDRSDRFHLYARR